MKELLTILVKNNKYFIRGIIILSYICFLVILTFYFLNKKTDLRITYDLGGLKIEQSDKTIRVLNVYANRLINYSGITITKDHKYIINSDGMVCTSDIAESRITSQLQNIPIKDSIFKFYFRQCMEFEVRNSYNLQWRKPNGELYFLNTSETLGGIDKNKEDGAFRSKLNKQSEYGTLLVFFAKGDYNTIVQKIINKRINTYYIGFGASISYRKNNFYIIPFDSTDNIEIKEDIEGKQMYFIVNDALYIYYKKLNNGEQIKSIGDINISFKGKMNLMNLIQCQLDSMIKDNDVWYLDNKGLFNVNITEE